MQKYGFNHLNTIASIHQNIWLRAARKKIALTLSTMLVSLTGVLFYYALINEMKSMGEETNKKNAAMNFKAELSKEEAENIFTGKKVAATKSRLWDVDPHLENLVDKQIRLWKASISPKTGYSPMNTIGRWLSKVSVYRDYIADSADKYSVDENFLTALLAWESRGNPKARSIKSARGFGQFMRITASEKGLVVNDIVDERLDPSKSIGAAASYIEDATKRYKSYRFLLTAYYNYGPGNVRKSIKKFGLNDKLFYKLPKETRMHYVNIFAIKKLLDSPEQYGFSYDLRPSFKKIVEDSTHYITKKGEDLSIIAKNNNRNIKMILYKNPKIVNPKRLRQGILLKI